MRPLAERRPRGRRGRPRPETPAAEVESAPGSAPHAAATLALVATLAAFVERWWFPRAWSEVDALGSAFYYGYVRLGLAYMPVVWVVQGAGLARLLGRVTPPSLASRGPAAALAASLALLAGEATRVTTARGATIDGPLGVDGAVVEDETVRVRRVGIRRPG